ncbi:hypothetical protein GCM10010222_32210 [Streptomyces tanashiensis]|nr:hypothetical protein GCM10010222_32210 [Streptomyces tanashiensis]GGY11763.1 hypothetical protein GCM10010299_15170 [Streptomyces tanashiensis]
MGILPDLADHSAQEVRSADGPGAGLTCASPAVLESSCPLAIYETDPTMDVVQVKNHAKFADEDGVRDE